MRPAESVLLASGRGIPGDRYHQSRHRHVSVQALEDLEAAADELGAPILPESTRRNITITGTTNMSTFCPSDSSEDTTVATLEAKVTLVA